MRIHVHDALRHCGIRKDGGYGKRTRAAETNTSHIVHSGHGLLNQTHDVVPSNDRILVVVIDVLLLQLLQQRIAPVEEGGDDVGIGLRIQQRGQDVHIAS